MAGCPVAADEGAVKKQGGRVTAYVLVTCVVAATGGLIFGYDIGISGGVTSMESFLKRFFPDVYRKMSHSAKQNDYCRFDSQVLTAFTSSLYVAGLVSSFVASAVTRAWGRNTSMLIGGATFLVGAAVNAAAFNVEMLIVGRILLGFGVGFGNQAVPIYLSEMAPARLRGALNIGFQLFIGIGVVSANLINYGTAKIDRWGWRLSLGGAAVPAVVMTTGSMFLPNTPSGFIERGDSEQARATLQSIRGTSEVQDELDDLIEANENSKKASHPFRSILQRKYRAHLVMAVAIPLFQQLTGINVIAFYAPVLFKTIGFGGNASLMAAVILGAVNLVSIVLSIFIVDKYGRRVLFMEGGIQMIICQVAIAGILGDKFGSAGEGGLSKGYAGLVLFLVCAYAAGFGWSWGPLSWLVPSEIFPLEIRSAGQSINVSVNLLVTFVLAQVFLSMLCHLKYAIFLFYAGWVAAMTLFVYLFLPETKNVPMEEMSRLWKEHWFWRRFVSDKPDGAASNDDVKSAEPQAVAYGIRKKTFEVLKTDI